MEILKEILENDKEKLKLIKTFQENVWNGDSCSSDESINEVLSELAYNLDYYEPNKIKRKESFNYFGNDRLIQEIASALEKIDKSKSKKE